ncbi:alanine--tRNA ligase [Mycoplasma nasistruthionis]|uniref:Alanine--tRNA ligase n=1 Tax=Mycoplasma nasistruthionis TaxID=353852 RepID=A0A4Y6I644_9MOLU|nr:alanine--tRNA ligase [Mycoplasma nasistruthionis]QDF65086.1 alanine--tRNA ligase [Mycoplasma nasistruthionis]
MNSKLIREKWLSFFESKQHFIVPSKSLVPQNDPSLLWINSGVATLKDYFSGKKNPPAKRLTNSQKAIRTNDIENVGVTARHHTFFEMLGNFSIGDYFKKEAIAFAVEFLLEVLKLDKDKLYFTYYYEDLETKELWKSHGFSEEHLIPGTKETNFWEVGSGPCGPNTEIFFDRGEKYDSRGIELLKEDIENDRYIEIWNIVFSTYNSNGEGEYTELKQKNIDTGAGFERLVSILQDAPTNFDTDLFLPIIHEIEKYTSYRYNTQNYFDKDPQQTVINTQFKVIADHMRTVVNAVADGAKPANIGRGYILRRLLRRSIYMAMQLGISELFLYKLVDTIKATLPFEYDVEPIAQVIKDEEIAFSKTIENGKNLLNNFINQDTKQFPGDLAFKLFETYGFPIELTTEILANEGISVNLDEFNQAKEKHADASRNVKKSGMDKVINSLALIKGKEDNFIGYTDTYSKSKIMHLLDTETEIDLTNGIAYLILDQTPFYATSGGQKHDRGYIKQNNENIMILDVFKDKHGNHIHKVEGKIHKNDPVECFVDETIRLGLERNHSGTHLLYCALRTVLGPEIKQLGSDNNELRLTFDMPAENKPTDEQIAQIEALVRSYIKQDAKRDYLNMTTEQAKEMGAIMTLEESEYMNPQNVRIVKFDNITADLCGGTHLSNTAKLENFKITNVDKKAAGVYRVRAISSNALVDEYLQSQIDELILQVEKAVEKNTKLDPNFVFDINIPEDKEQAISYLKESLFNLKETNKQLNKNLSNSNEFDFDNIEVLNINGHKVYINQTLSNSNIKTVASTLREKYSDVLVVLTTADANPMLVIASKAYNSNLIAQQIFAKFAGRGGGNAILSMGKIATADLLLDFISNELKWEN